MKGEEDLLDVPMYSPVLTSRLVGLRPERVRRWLRGYEYKYKMKRGTGTAERRRQGPVIRREGAPDSPYATFMDLVDLLFVKRFVDVGISLQKLRLALKEATELLGGHRFAHRDFWTDGKNIFMEIEGRGDALLELASHGQWAIAPVIKQVAKHIDFAHSTGIAERWFPMGRGGCIVLDPLISFGSPSVVGRGIATANVFDLYKAEGNHVPTVCSWLEMSPREVGAAVEFEARLIAA